MRLFAGISPIPPEAAERWVSIDCDCGGVDRPHANEFRIIEGDFLCMAAPDEDGVVWKWRVLLIPDGRVANGWGHTKEECQLQAEMTARALATDKAAYNEAHPESRPFTH